VTSTTAERLDLLVIPLLDLCPRNGHGSGAGEGVVRHAAPGGAGSRTDDGETTTGETTVNRNRG
jgi:hypothetical protein